MKKNRFLFVLIAAMVILGIAAAGAQPKVRVVLKDFDTDRTRRSLSSSSKRAWRPRAHRVKIESGQVPSGSYAGRSAS